MLSSVVLTLYKIWALLLADGSGVAFGCLSVCSERLKAMRQMAEAVSNGRGYVQKCVAYWEVSNLRAQSIPVRVCDFARVC